MKNAFLVVMLLVAASVPRCGVASASEISPAPLLLSAPFVSDPAMDVRSNLEAWIFRKDFRANEPKETTFEEYILSVGENLWTVAGKPAVYGDFEMYPLLAEANPEYFKASRAERVGMSLRVPRDFGPALAQEARAAAWSPMYADRIGMRFTRAHYQEWLVAYKAQGRAVVASAKTAE